MKADVDISCLFTSIRSLCAALACCATSGGTFFRWISTSSISFAISFLRSSPNEYFSLVYYVAFIITFSNFFYLI